MAVATRDPIDIRNLTAVKNSDVIVPLGRLCWYTVFNSTSVTRSELEERFSNYDLDSKWLPKPIRSVDAFRRASSSLALGNIEIGEGLRANFLVREVVSNKEEIVRQGVWELVDSNDKTLSYLTVAEMRLDKEFKGVSVKYYDATPALVKEICDRLLDAYDRCLNKYDGDAIRKMVSGVIRDLHATAVRPSGAVYFIPEKRVDTLNKLGRVLKDIECEFFAIPLVDSQDSRDMVCKKFIEQTTSKIKEISEVLKDPALKKGACFSALKETKHFLQSVNEYRSMLHVNLQDLEKRLQLLNMQAVTLINKAAEVK